MIELILMPVGINGYGARHEMICFGGQMVEDQGHIGLVVRWSKIKVTLALVVSRSKNKATLGRR